jgi:RNA polymerase sigma factor (sigma-70 family)
MVDLSQMIKTDSGALRRPPAESPLARPETESSWALLERARGGDREALERLCGRYIPRLRRWARGRLPRPAREMIDTDDLVQDAVVDTLKHIERFDPQQPSSFQAYLRRTIVNKIRNEIRRTSRKPAVESMTGEEMESGPSPLDITAGRELAERYNQALAHLPEEDQEAIISRVEMGCSYTEVADVLGKASPDAARMALGRALVRLIKEMKNARG